ncbi:MAG: DUF3667 domain-containing protein [Colwellia sp.]|nr:DUF3667 domain-containing protein [Colwellia sp.]
MNQCLNCKASLNQQNKYCPVCGQSTMNLHQSFTSIAFQALHEMLDIDGRLAKTLKLLLFSPGRLSKEYTEGRRMSYSPPLRLYLVISLLFFVVISLIQTTATNQLDHIQVGMFLFPVGMLEQVPKLMFVMLPLYALIVQLFHRKTFYVFNLIFALHVHSLIYLLLIIIFPMNRFENMHLALSWLQYPFIAYLAFYPLMALKTMYGNSWLYTLRVYVLTVVLYLASIGLGLEFINIIMTL